MSVFWADLRSLDLLAAWGIPYSYGGGEPRHGAGRWPPVPLPRGINGGRGWDCSGFAQAALVRLGLLEADAPDRACATLWSLSSAVPLEEARVGDLAFYGSGPRDVSHVMVYVGRDSGNGLVVLGARGGRASTNGDDPHAYVDLQPLKYRSDFLGLRRLPAVLPRRESGAQREEH